MMDEETHELLIKEEVVDEASQSVTEEREDHEQSRLLADEKDEFVEKMETSQSQNGVDLLEENMEIEESCEPVITTSDKTLITSTISTGEKTEHNGNTKAIDDVLKYLNGDDEEEDSRDSGATEEYFNFQTLSNINDDVEMPELTPLDKLNLEKEKGIEESSRQQSSSSNQEERESEMPMLLPIPSEQGLTFSQETKMEEDIEKFLCSRTEDSASVHDEQTFDESELSRDFSPVASPASASDKGKKSSIVDSLLDKIRRKNSDSSGSDIGKLQRMLSESDDDLLVEIDAPVSYSRSSNPNQMATPIVRDQKSETSAFVNNEEEYKQIVNRQSKVPKEDSILRKELINKDQSQMGEQSEPPRMQAPQLLNIPKPRTLAEKRQLVNQNSVNYLMVEQESKIYKQVQQKKQNLPMNYNYIDLMMWEDVPINPGVWKVLTWLRTRQNNYIQLSIKIDGAIYKIKGSCGNHRVRLLAEQTSQPYEKHFVSRSRSTRCCMGGHIKKRELEKLISVESIRKFILRDNSEVQKRLETKFLDNQLVSIKPRPLSKKIELINKRRNNLERDEDGVFLGDYAKFAMPEIKLEVTAGAKSSLDPVAKKYLQEIMPHRDLDENWCEFALTALSTKDNEEDESRSTFEFTIPYQDNKNSILVRDIVKSTEDSESLRILLDDTEEEQDEMEWTFAENCDKDDPVECEVVDIIKDLTNSVFINLNDNLFTQEDTDIPLPSESSPLKSQKAIEELSNLPKHNRSKRVLMELKRLNANVYQTDSVVEDVSFCFLIPKSIF